jgi:transposase
MGKSLSTDLRLRMAEAVSSGKSCRTVAMPFKVAPSTVIRLVRRQQQTGSLAPAKQGRPFGWGRLGAMRDFLISRVQETPDITMPELAAALHTVHGLKAHPGSISKLLRAAGFSYKKNAAGERARTFRCQEGPH